MNHESIKNLPKIDLHCHLDGSLSADFIRRHAEGRFDHTEDAQLAGLLTAPEHCADLAEYLTRFDLPVSCLQTEEALSDAVFDVLEQADSEHVVYCELRFAPNLHTARSLSINQVIEAALKGLKKSTEALPIKANLILCAMRHHSEEQNLSMLRAAREYLGAGVCAIDLAGDEAHFDNTLFVSLFREAKKLGMPFTVHSGECGSAENVALAMELGASRVGHGIAIIKRPDIMEQAKKHALGLELCPISNYQTNAVGAQETYPLKSFLAHGLLATVNTDNRTVSNTSMTRELTTCLDSLGLEEEALETLYENSVHIAFADDNTKHRLLQLSV